MSRIADISRFVDDYRSAELITGALQDISSTKMLSIRKDFELNARFFGGIREVYAVVKTHASEIEKKSEEQQRKNSGKDICIALTSNKRFYGTLNRDIVHGFVRMVDTHPKNTDFLIVGQTGAQYLDATGFRGKITRTEFEDDTPNVHELQSLFALVDSYVRVFVIYPKFVNTFRQEIAMTDITQTPDAAISSDMKAQYIFEPEIPNMLAFFEAQVRRALFERVLLETELARVAVRTLKMRNARDHAGDLRKKYAKELRREVETLADLALMETFVGFNLWHH